MTSRISRVTFPGSRGTDLDARLDLPAGPPKAYAVFAHCFTCSPDLHAASRIAASLTEVGFAVMRFDFTGHGTEDVDAGDEFANVGFSANVSDLIAAADWLRSEHRAPQLLVGHSLGGSAALVAAGRIPEVRAVATIAAPSEAWHITRLFPHAIEHVEAGGIVEIELGGRSLSITPEFLDDLRHGAVLDAAASLRKALLILHSPVDNVVGIDHAASVFQAARHPKSFVTLDGADHLLTGHADAAYAAAIIGSWSQRYLVDESGAAAPPPATAQVVVSETTQSAYLNHVVVGRHRFLADEPEHVGGFDAGPGPYDFLATALGACTSMTLRLYADHKSMAVGRITVEVEHDKIHLDDAGRVDTSAPGKIDRFRRRIAIEGDLDEPTRANLLRIADKCPVHRTLSSTAHIETVVV